MKTNSNDHKPGVSPNFIEPRDLGDRPWGQRLVMPRRRQVYDEKLFIKKRFQGWVAVPPIQR